MQIRVAFSYILTFFKTILSIYNTLIYLFTNFSVPIAFILGFTLGFLIGKREISVIRNIVSVPINITLYIINIIILSIGIGNQIVTFVYIVAELVEILLNVANVFIWTINEYDYRTKFTSQFNPTTTASERI